MKKLIQVKLVFLKYIVFQLSQAWVYLIECFCGVDGRFWIMSIPTGDRSIGSLTHPTNFTRGTTPS